MTLNELKCRWHFIDGYDYLVTEFGDVYSYRPNKDEKRGFKGLRKLKLKGVNNPKRYLSVVLSRNNIKKTVQVHRLVGKYFVDGYFDGAVINHKDRDKHNNYYKNLEWVTQRENVRKQYVFMDQVRNFKKWRIVFPNGGYSNVLRGKGDIDKYINSNSLPVKISMLIKHKNHNGFILQEVT